MGQSSEYAPHKTALDCRRSRYPPVQRRPAVDQGLQRRGQYLQEWPLFDGLDPGLGRPGAEERNGLLILCQFNFVGCGLTHPTLRASLSGGECPGNPLS